MKAGLILLGLLVLWLLDYREGDISPYPPRDYTCSVCGSSSSYGGGYVLDRFYCLSCYEHTFREVSNAKVS